jgi:FAD/FMN-containing dehydrogenase
VVCAGVLWTQFSSGCKTQDPLVLNDVSRLNQTRVSEVVHATTEDALRDAVRRAREGGFTVSISGAKHSQGGHAFHDDSIHLDMTGFNRILSLDEEQKTIRVQSGATWSDIQKHVNPQGLSVAVMQSSNIFTVGGSLSANAHGRDPRFGPVIETVRSFRLLTADGTVLNVSRTENEELFALVIGGFGLFGVILDVELTLIDDTVYGKETVLLDYEAYPKHFAEHVKDNPKAGLHFGRLSIAPDTLLRDAYAVTYYETKERPKNITKLSGDRFARTGRFFFGLSRNWDWAKNTRWSAQKTMLDVPNKTVIESRNNAMRPPIRFLEYESDTDSDILQEYFVPPNRLVEFIDVLREVVEEEEINLLSVTLRYVPKNDEAYLSYAKSESFAVVLYINQALSDEGRAKANRWTSRLVDAVHDHDGTYFLVYQRYPSQQQLRTGYPRFDEFIKRKKHYDPKTLFMNGFYTHYADN